MKGPDRKAAITAYNERKQVVGVFAVRCSVSGEIWVGKTPNLDTIQNRFWFTLRQRAHPNRELQSAWSAHGEASFSFEVLEQLPDEEGSYSRDILLQERVDHWRASLNATVA
jgi:hypothetical protein